jgi:hypothetical protein
MTSTNSTQVIPLESADELQEAVLRLAQQAQREITLFTRVLEPERYNTPGFVDALLQLLKHSRYSRIRMLVSDTRLLGENCQRLLKLLRATDERFLLRKITVDPASVTPAYLICDDHSMIRWPNAALHRAICYTADRARVKQQMEDYNQLWGTAVDDPNLRQLSL